jgi:DNA-directed RNA polymerase specialized sigma24 family protein
LSLAERDRNEALRRCLGELSPHVRTAVLLRFQEGFSYEEMARAVRERAPALQARVARALPVLRRCLEGRGFAA